jgi:adenine-specific DNA-methyltransferase
MESEITTKAPIKRLNYIGSKFQLLDWMDTTIKETTGWTDWTNKHIADLFGGTGVVSHYFRTQGASVQSNDAELYSSIITHAFTRSVYTDACKHALVQLNQTLADKTYLTTPVGFITQNYSPHNGNERKFWTEDNARRIDAVRAQLETMKPTLTHDDYIFCLASLLLSADAVSNVPAVYGCYLKEFKAKATKPLLLVPIHTISTPPKPDSATFHSDVLDDTFLSNIRADLTYLDPPYNERQYSKNYFPLNVVALTPDQQQALPALKGKTGIPQDCFISPFCKKGQTVLDAFDKLFRTLDTTWIILSYNSESLVSKDKMLELMGKYGTVSVVERDYKRFKSFEYNEDKAIKEYLFCLEKHT